MSGFITVEGESIAVYEEKRSKFIATVRHIETEEEASAFLAEQRAKYWDARHNCHAFVLKNGVKRFSDDSEPHGTAGKPILEVIEGNGLVNIMVVVTRYFGGVLLGTGGLVKAYSTSAGDAVSSADKVRMVACTALKTKADYSSLDMLLRLINDFDGTVLNIEYTDTVEVEYYLEDVAVEGFLLRLKETFAARLSAEEIKKELYPVKI